MKAHRRVIRRKRYRPSCSCPDNKPIVTAPPAPRVIPKSKVGVSIWVLILLDKYLFQRPTYRLLAALRLHDLDLSLGSITDGLKHLEPLFTPLYDRAKIMVEALKNVEGDIVLVGISNEGSRSAVSDARLPRAA